MSKKLHGYTLRMNIIGAFSTLFILTISSIMLYTYYNNTVSMFKVSDNLVYASTEIVLKEVETFLNPVSQTTELLLEIARQENFNILGSTRIENASMEVLKKYPQIDSVYYGDEAGNFFIVERNKMGGVSSKLTDFSQSKVVWKHRDTDEVIVNTEVADTNEYDPRVRPWYIDAKQAKGKCWTDTYIFFFDKMPGITIADPAIDRDGNLMGVLGLDIRLECISNFLNEFRQKNSETVFIYNNNKEIVAFPDASKTIVEVDGAFKPSKISECNEPVIQTAFQKFEELSKNKFNFDYDGKQYLASFCPFPKSFEKEWYIGIVVNEDQFVGDIKTTNKVNLFISAFVLLLSLMVISYISKNISEPIALLTYETERIKDFQLDGELNISSPIREINLINDSIVSLKKGVSAFKKYVPATLVKQLIETDQDVKLGGKNAELTVMFSQVKNFNLISEKLPAEVMMANLSEYMNEMSKILTECRVTIDKYIGNIIMAFCGAPVYYEDHAVLSCRAALLCKKKLAELNNKWASENKMHFDVEFGIHSGAAIVGNMGSSERINYTIIGDSVNLASRLKEVNKVYQTNIIISQSTYHKVKNDFICRPLDIVTVKGRNKPITIYEILDFTEDNGSLAQDISLYTEAFNLHIGREWDASIDIFRKLRSKYPDDNVLSIMIKRCEKYKENPPPKDWNGVRSGMRVKDII